MTATTHPHAGIDTDSEAFQTAFAEMDRRQKAFDAVRTPCPDWCDKSCADDGDMGDAILHCDEISVQTTSDRIDEPNGLAWVKAWRYESLDADVESGIEIDLRDARAIMPDSATFSAVQARTLAAALLRQANLIDPSPSAGGAR